MNNNLIIFILAGGFGTRLKNVVADVPKPMAPILNKPFLEYQISVIREYFPTNKIYLLTHYKSEIIENYFDYDKNIEIIKEEIPLGTGGSIKNSIDLLNLTQNERIMVFNGDTYIKPKFEDLLKNNSPTVIVGSFQENCDRYGTLVIDDNGIINFNEKKEGVKNSYINAGCYLFNTLDFFSKIDENSFSIENKFKEYLLNYKIGLFRYNGVFIDIGIPEDYYKMIKYIGDNGA